ncbi:putative secereted protein, contains kinase-interacting SIMPL domain [Halanaeroarchaeum sp. HSR-CO]|uniref:SIMPL domain-containing protein n=1 Tax=Halanaeroarchaeum sp. HSR-CO TaxID=2866382 RepID=UPI00217EA7F7|nr:SIMPL domain-containing protein [Halanaeroarchaeum sp. HSR-CO]UWG47531.1 putative secereted protein, contains kinase-interacting SIMPL domain [Halanaeroarchaeum sp. HSR-CO]
MSRPVQSLIVGVLVILAAVTSAGAVLALDDGSQSNQLENSTAQSGETITVSASGEAQAQPDKAVLRMAVEADDTDVTEARSTVAEDVSSVKEALVEMGIEEEQIRTTDYRIYEDDRRTKPTEEDSQPIYRVRHVLTVDVNETDQVGGVIDTAVDAGVTSVHDVRFTLTSETQRTLKNEALENAMDDADTQAETLAQSANLQIDGVATVETGSSGIPRPVYAMEAAAGGDAATDISSGPVTVSAQVRVTYAASR